ncbi:MAG: type I 3-dehydroquinate dehydratase [Halodesulfurarchaeum sp.]
MDLSEFVLAASTASLSAEPDAREHADALEFRMDLAADPLADLSDHEGDLPIIVTNRPEWEGGERTDGEERIQELLEAVEMDGVEAVDVELGALKDVPVAAADASPVVERAVAADLTVVVSTHDFDSTPSLSEMADRASQVCTLGDVGKLAVTAESRGDVLDLLRVTHEFDRAEQSIATIAMGSAGRHSRAVAPLYGSKLGYAPVDREEATAPGQYDLETLAELIDALR